METKFYFESKADGLKISALRIEPDEAKDIKGVVQLVHGMCEYKERYVDFMNFLVSQGYLCVIHDHRGHGESIKDIKDLGYMYEGGFRGMIEDIHEVTNMTKEYVEKVTGKANLPYILLGHSMGSMAVRTYVKKYDYEIDKLLVVGCPSKMAGMGPGLVLINILKAIKGGHGHSKLVDYLVSGANYEKRFKSEKLLHAWINSDRSAVEKYNADPYCNYCFTLNGYKNLVQLTKETYSLKNYCLSKKDLPIYFFSGSEDPCAISRSDFGKAINTMKQAGYTNVKGHMYEGMRHEILNEPGKEKVYKDMLKFIEG